MRLWPDLLFASGREVSGHLVCVADGRITAVRPATPDDPAATDVARLKPVVRGQRLATLAEAGLMERVRALTADWRPA
jgi:hypothetical protein